MIDSCQLYPYIMIPVDIWTSAGIFFSQSFNDDFICFLFFLVPEKKGTKQLLENYLHRTWNQIYPSKRNKCVSE